MIDYKELYRVQAIENGFAEYPWLEKYLQKNMLRELVVEGDAGADFYKSRIDAFIHIEVMLLLGKNGEYLGEVDEVKIPNGVGGCCSFAPRQETVMEAIQRIPGETYFILKNKNFTHATFYKASQGMSLCEHAQQFAHLF